MAFLRFKNLFEMNCASVDLVTDFSIVGVMWRDLLVHFRAADTGGKEHFSAAFDAHVCMCNTDSVSKYFALVYL
jgi:hypothetical protein